MRHGEVAAIVSEPRLCGHEIASDARSCECGMRIALVVGPLQLAFFEWPRRMNPHQRNMSRIANDGYISEVSGTPREGSCQASYNVRLITLFL